MATSLEWKARFRKMADDFRGLTKVPPEHGDDLLMALTTRAGHLLWMAYTDGVFHVEDGIKWTFDRIATVNGDRLEFECQTLWLMEAARARLTGCHVLPPNLLVIRELEKRGNTTVGTMPPELWYARALNYADLSDHIADNDLIELVSPDLLNAAIAVCETQNVTKIEQLYSALRERKHSVAGAVQRALGDALRERGYLKGIKPRARRRTDR